MLPTRPMKLILRPGCHVSGIEGQIRPIIVENLRFTIPRALTANIAVDLQIINCVIAVDDAGQTRLQAIISNVNME